FPTFQAAGTPAEATAGPISPAWPTHQSGDIALLIIESDGWPIRLSTPAGFKELPCSPTRVDSVGDGDGSRTWAHWCRATGAAMGAPTIEFPSEGGDHIRAVILTFRGCAASGVPFNACLHRVFSTTPTTAATFPAVITTDADSLIVYIVGHHADNESATVSGW